MPVSPFGNKRCSADYTSKVVRKMDLLLWKEWKFHFVICRLRSGKEDKNSRPLCERTIKEICRIKCFQLLGTPWQGQIFYTAQTNAYFTGGQIRKESGCMVWVKKITPRRRWPSCYDNSICPGCTDSPVGDPANEFQTDSVWKRLIYSPIDRSSLY